MIIRRTSGRAEELFIVSTSPNLDNTILYPEVPKSILTLSGVLDTIPRISIFDNISDALSVVFLGEKINGLTISIYSPLNLRYENFLSPEITSAPYLLALDGKEWWYTAPVRLKKVGEIKITNLKEEKSYRYGPRQKKAPLYKWGWEEIKPKWEKKKR